MKKIAIIGHFGGNEQYFDGQTIKTKKLYDELLASTDWDIEIVDTYFKRNCPIRLLLHSLKVCFTVKDIIILLSENGMRFYFPLLSFFIRIFNTRIYHNVIGGNLAGYVKNNQAYKNYLNLFCINWVETMLLKEELKRCGVTNVDVIANFRRSVGVNADEFDRAYFEPFRFCTFSRVLKEKGIEDAIRAVQSINADVGREYCTLDIWGPIDDGYRKQFDEIMSKVTPSIHYCGASPHNQAIDILKTYYATLFPTYWKSEGSAGTVIESQSAGVPVIATDWRCNGEMIQSGQNGIIYPGKEAKDLKSAILWMIAHSQDMYNMKLNALKTAKKYEPEHWVEKIVNFIEASSKAE